MYDLTPDKLKGIANLCKQEQGSWQGAAAEATLASNILRTSSTYKAKFGNDIYSFMRNSGWFSCAAYWMDNGNAGNDYVSIVRDVLVNGYFTLPIYVNEHDCFSDILWAKNGDEPIDKRNRSEYIPHLTRIRNKYGSEYTFFAFPAPNSDPFGYTKEDEKMSGKLSSIIEMEREYAKIPYMETGNNHQVFSSVVNNVGLAGCQDQPWCCTYQFAMEVMEFGVERALMNWNMTRWNYCGYSCFETFDAFKEAGKTGDTPKLGALVVFNHSHIGRVLSINSAAKTFECGEGNTSNAEYDRNGDSCAVKTYFWNDSRIKGFCYIDYEDAPHQEAEEKETEGKTVFAFGNVEYNKDGSFKADDYVLQTILRGRGFTGRDGKPLKLDGIAQGDTMFAANAYMDARAKAGVDLGERDCWGPKCWADIFGRKPVKG